ncbi:uncharacterized protein LOC120342578 isoform X1 [Styela clava]
MTLSKNQRLGLLLWLRKREDKKRRWKIRRCYKFLAVDIGAYGRASDGEIFANSCFGRRLQNGTLSPPSPRTLPLTNGPTVTFVYLGDEAFPLKEYLMRPFPGNGLLQEKKNFNYRLSRA